ncbi:M12 family metallo-peptidase [Flavobacterium sp.]
MKKHLLILLSFFCFLSSFGQNKIGQKMQQLQKENTQFSSISLLTVDKSISKKDIDKAVSQATLAKTDINNVNQIASGQFEFLELEIPYLNQDVKIQLYRVDIFSEDFKINTDKNKNISYQKGVYYRGMIKGDAHSVAAFNFFNGEFNGIFSSDKFGNVQVGKIDKPNNQNDYIIYSDVNLKVVNDFECHVKEDKSVPLENSTLSREVNTAKCVTFYFEIDYNLFQSNNNSTTTTANWMSSVFNNVQTLFDNDGITTALKSVFIWTSPDIYDGIGTASSDYLYAFANNRPVFNGDVAMLVGIDPGGLGGVAFLNQVCNDLNYAYADINGISYSTVPNYSWTIQVMTHEFGHSLGSSHTHACKWNGNNTPIDGCGSQAGYPETGCSVVGPIPSTTEKGTIMSYCHLISGVGINFANGFGPQPSNLIFNTVNSKSCLSTDCVSTCINTITNIQVANPTTTSVLVTWQDLDDTIGNWEISVAAFGAPIVWQSVTASSFSKTGLMPNTYYKVRIRPTCIGITPTVRDMIFATSGDYCSGMLFTDTGGTSGNHGNLESFTRTFIPSLPNKKIVVTFSQFSLEDNFDFMYIYDGPDDTYPELSFADGFTGTNSPGIVESSAVDGSLTFKFVSDQLENDLGWVANVTCASTLGISANDFIDFAYYPNPTKNNITLKSNTTITEIEVFNIEGRKLFAQKLEALESTVDLSQFASGTYFFKVRFNGVEKNFKILKM